MVRRSQVPPIPRVHRGTQRRPDRPELSEESSNSSEDSETDSEMDEEVMSSPTWYINIARNAKKIIRRPVKRVLTLRHTIVFDATFASAYASIQRRSFDITIGPIVEAVVGNEQLFNFLTWWSFEHVPIGDLLFKTLRAITETGLFQYLLSWADDNHIRD